MVHSSCSKAAQDCTTDRHGSGRVSKATSATSTPGWALPSRPLTRCGGAGFKETTQELPQKRAPG